VLQPFSERDSGKAVQRINNHFFVSFSLFPDEFFLPTTISHSQSKRRKTMTTKTIRFLAILLFALGLTLFSLHSHHANTKALANSLSAQNPFDTGGRDDKPAGEVFKNIQALKGLPAGRLRDVMQSWTRALGIRCDHCHVIGQWDKDEKPEKQIARDMVMMTGKINNESLKGIKNLKSEKPSVSCYTCHRGATKPETTLPPPPPKQ
jgi:hypothetical protein